MAADGSCWTPEPPPQEEGARGGSGRQQRGDQQSGGEWSWTQVRKPAKSIQESGKQSRGGGGEPGTAGTPPDPLGHISAVTQNPSSSDQSIALERLLEWEQPSEAAFRGADTGHRKASPRPRRPCRLLLQHSGGPGELQPRTSVGITQKPAKPASLPPSITSPGERGQEGLRREPPHV